MRKSLKKYFAMILVDVVILAITSTDAVRIPLSHAASDGSIENGPQTANFRITEKFLKPLAQIPSLGANGWGGSGAIEYAANNFIHDSGNEPIYWKNMHRIKECGPGWFEIDGPGTSWWDLWGSGFLSGANLKIYRIIDKENSALPLNFQANYLNLEKADHVVLVGKTQVIPAGGNIFPDGGWVANRYSTVLPNSLIRHGNLSCVDVMGIESGRTYWYAMTAVGSDGKESEISNEVSVDASAGTKTSPHILVASDADGMPILKPGEFFEFTPKVYGGAGPLWWQAADEQDKPLALPKGLQIERSTGKIYGKMQEALIDFTFRLKVVDAKGEIDWRRYVINPSTPTKNESEAKLLPPSHLTATAEDGCVILRWDASSSAGVTGYRLKRSTAPLARQETRVHVVDGAPKLMKFDYVVIEKKMLNFDMRWVNSRVRGMGGSTNEPNWYWQVDPSKLSLSLVPHLEPIPDEMSDAGETCLQIKSSPGEQTMSQWIFIGPKHGSAESLWYGQLEPGKKYHMEAWLRQIDLKNDGLVIFSMGKGYADIHQAFKVSNEWKKYSFDFIGPAYPKTEGVFGPTFVFSGPGKLWMDNCKISRYDAIEDADKTYTPNHTVIQELLKSQPQTGPKGAHRIWFLNRDATMSDLLSWHANSRVSVDWLTQVGASTEMTIPMGLEFDLQTGVDAKSRMRPWLVMQHLLHSEEDWQHFVEYLAAPYDPKVDTPQAKPWAYRRYAQRGIGTPWTDEFSQITIEFGNETWHNGHFPDFLGFGMFGAIHQGGKEYGLFTRYLCEAMKKSPYWKTQDLDHKIRFALGGNYDGQVNWRGKVWGYGEEAMKANPYATILGHANYVGPKWETGEYASRNYTDEGIQKCLVSFLSGSQENQMKMGQARDALAKSNHDYDLAAYEGGPGGFALPGSVKPEEVETNEKYGKSLAQAVAALDAWMRSYEYGWTDQCFFSYGQGSHWNSHTPFAEGFRPGPAWLAMTLRNRYASGDLMKVEETSIPKVQVGGSEYPAMSVYAFREKTTWSVMVLSRKLDGFTPANLRLPFTKATKITLHKLSDDPRQTNRDKMNVEIESLEIPAPLLKEGNLAVNERSGGSKEGMPAGSIFFYVLEEAAK